MYSLLGGSVDLNKIIVSFDIEEWLRFAEEVPAEQALKKFGLEIGSDVQQKFIWNLVTEHKTKVEIPRKIQKSLGFKDDQEFSDFMNGHGFKVETVCVPKNMKCMSSTNFLQGLLIMDSRAFPLRQLYLNIDEAFKKYTNYQYERKRRQANLKIAILADKPTPNMDSDHEGIFGLFHNQTNPILYRLVSGAVEFYQSEKEKLRTNQFHEVKCWKITNSVRTGLRLNEAFREDKFAQLWQIRYNESVIVKVQIIYNNGNQYNLMKSSEVPDVEQKLIELIDNVLV